METRPVAGSVASQSSRWSTRRAVTTKVPLPPSPKAWPAAARPPPDEFVSCRSPLRYQVRLGAAARQVKARLSASRKLLTDRARPSILVSDVATAPAAERSGGYRPEGTVELGRKARRPPPYLVWRAAAGTAAAAAAAATARARSSRAPSRLSGAGGGTGRGAPGRAASLRGAARLSLRDPEPRPSWAARREGLPEHHRPLTSRMRQQRFQPTGTLEIPAWISRSEDSRSCPNTAATRLGHGVSGRAAAT